MRIKDGREVCGSAIQESLARPRDDSTQFKNPYSKLYIQRQTTATATMVVTWGEKSAMR